MSTALTNFSEIYWGKSKSIRTDDEAPPESVGLHINVFADPLKPTLVPFTLPCFADFASVTHLSFANLGMTTDFFLKEVCPVLTSLPRLTSLCLANNNLTAPALTAIADMVVPPPVYASLVTPVVNDVSFFPVTAEGVVSTCPLSTSRGATNPLAHWHTLHTTLLVDRAAVAQPGSGCTCGSTHRAPPLAWLDLSHNPLFGACALHAPAVASGASAQLPVSVVEENTNTVATEDGSDGSDDEWATRLFPRRSRPAPPSAAERIAALMAPLTGLGLGGGSDVDGAAGDASQGVPDAARDPVLAALASLPALATHARAWTHVDAAEQAAAVEARTRAAAALLRLLGAVSAGSRGGAGVGMGSADAARGCCAARAALEADASRHRAAHVRLLQNADAEETGGRGPEWGALHAIAEVEEAEEAEEAEAEDEERETISGGSGTGRARVAAAAAAAPCSGRACLSPAAAAALAQAPPHASPLRALALADTALPPALAALLASYARALAHLPAPRALTTLALTQDAAARFPLPVPAGALPPHAAAAAAPTDTLPQWVAGTRSPVLPQAMCDSYASSASGPAAPMLAAAEDAVAQLAHASRPSSHSATSATVCAAGVLANTPAAPTRVGAAYSPPLAVETTAIATHGTRTTSSSWARPSSASSQATTSTHTAMLPVSLPSPASPADLAAENAAADPLLAAFLAAVQPDTLPERTHSPRTRTPTRSRSLHAQAHIPTHPVPVLPPPSPSTAAATAPRARTLLVYAPDGDVLVDDSPTSPHPRPHSPPFLSPSAQPSRRPSPLRDLRPSSQRSRRALSPTAAPSVAAQRALAALYADLDGADGLDALSDWATGLSALATGPSPAPAPVSRSRVVLGAHTVTLAHEGPPARASVSAAVREPLQPPQPSQSPLQSQHDTLPLSRSAPSRPSPPASAAPAGSGPSTGPSTGPSAASSASTRPPPRAPHPSQGSRVPGSSRPPAPPPAARESPRPRDAPRPVAPHAPSRDGVAFIRQARPPSAPSGPQTPAASSVRSSAPTPPPALGQPAPLRQSHTPSPPSSSPTFAMAGSFAPRSLRESAPPPTLAPVPSAVSQRIPISGIAGSTQSARVRAAMPSHTITLVPNAGPPHALHPMSMVQPRQSRPVSDTTHQ